jgi:hypothetical protein
MTENSLRLKIGEYEIEVRGEQAFVNKIIKEHLEKVLAAFPNVITKKQAMLSEVIEERKRKSPKRTGELAALKQRIPILKNEGFFDEPKTLTDIRKALQSRGWYHSSPNIQRALLNYALEFGIKRIGSEEIGYRYVKI